MNPGVHNAKNPEKGFRRLAALLVLSACQPGGVEQKPTLTVGVSGAFAENLPPGSDVRERSAARGPITGSGIEG